MKNKFEIDGYTSFNKYILGKEDRILRLMRGENYNESLQESSSLNCSYVTFLLANWIINETIGVKEVKELEGYGKGLTAADGHSILGVETREGWCCVDGTIWQVNHDADHMYVSGPFIELSILLQALSKVYGGMWKDKEIPEGLISNKGARQNTTLLKNKAIIRGLQRNRKKLK